MIQPTHLILSFSMAAAGLLVWAGPASASAANADAATEPAPAATRELPELIQRQLDQGSRRVTIPPGVYRVTPENGHHLRLADLENVEIEAEGVEMICTETTRAITIENCNNLTIRGLSIDYDPLPFSQGRIVSISDDTLTHEIELFEDYPAADSVQANKYEIYDPQTRELRFGSYFGLSVQAVDERRVRMTIGSQYANVADRPERVGDWVVMTSRQVTGPFIPHTIQADACENLVLEDVTVYAFGFGFFETNCSASVYRRCKVDRRALQDEIVPRQHARLRSLNIDGFHSKHARVGPRYLGCEARFMADDGIAINGHYHLVTHSDGDTLRVIAKRTDGFTIDQGETVEMLGYDGQRRDNATVVSVRRTHDITPQEDAFLRKQPMDQRMQEHQDGMLTHGYEVVLDRPVDLEMGSVIGSRDRVGSGFQIIDCVMEYNRSRGVIVKASDGEIRGNRFAGNWGEAILVSPNFWWLESGSSENLLIQDNTITDPIGIPIGVYAFSPRGEPLPPGALRHITIRDNVIRDSPRPGIYVTSTTGLVLQGNTIEIDPGKQLAPSVIRQRKLKGKLNDVVLIETREADAEAGAETEAKTHPRPASGS